MSSYLRNTKHPRTRKFEPAAWIDDYFGSHHYGVLWRDGTMTDPERVKLDTNQLPVKAKWDDFLPESKKHKVVPLDIKQLTDTNTGGAHANVSPKSKLAQVPQEDISEVDIINVIYGEKDGAFTVDMRKVQRLRSFISREKAKSFNEGYQKGELEGRIEEVGKALSYTTMDELKNRYYFLVDMDGGTPFKRQFISKEVLKSQEKK